MKNKKNNATRNRKIVVKKRRRNPYLPDLKNFVANYQYFPDYKEYSTAYNSCIRTLLELFENSTTIAFIDSGSYGSVFKIKINKKLFLQNEFIFPGIYAIKFYTKPIQKNCFELLNLCSKYGIVPKIYLHNKCFMLMKFIAGKTLEELYDHDDYIDFLDKRQNLINVFYKIIPRKYLISRLDITDNPSNYIVSSDLKKVYMIDPCY